VGLAADVDTNNQDAIIAAAEKMNQEAVQPENTAEGSIQKNYSTSLHHKKKKGATSSPAAVSAPVTEAAPQLQRLRRCPRTVW